MCVISNVGDDYRGGFPDRWPNIPMTPLPSPSTNTIVFNPAVTREEFLALKAEVEQLRILLLEAKAQDIAEGNAGCEMEEKVAFLKQVAEFVGVDLSEVFGD